MFLKHRKERIPKWIKERNFEKKAASCLQQNGEIVKKRKDEKYLKRG